MSRLSMLVAAAALVLVSGCNKGSSSAAPPSSAPGAEPEAPIPAGARVIDVKASNEGYTPSKLDIKKGETVVLRFTRTTKSDCLAQVRIPKLNVTKDLPLDKPVNVVVKTDDVGDIGFACGMGMVKGNIHVGS